MLRKLTLKSSSDRKEIVMTIIFTGAACALFAYVGITHVCHKIDKISNKNESFKRKYDAIEQR